jgi:hypothetical protein
MVLDELGGTVVPFSEVAKLFPGEAWLEMRELMNDGDETPTRVVEGGARVEGLVAGDGPWALVVHGDLHATGDLDFSTTDYAVSTLVVCGNVTARNLYFSNGDNCFITGDLTCTGVVVGQHGDESARLVVEGRLEARALMVDHVTGVEAEELDALVCSAEGWGLPLDLDQGADSHRELLHPETLDEDGRVDVSAVWAHASAGGELFLPGVEATLRERRA